MSVRNLYDNITTFPYGWSDIVDQQEENNRRSCAICSGEIKEAFIDGADLKGYCSSCHTLHIRQGVRWEVTSG